MLAVVKFFVMEANTMSNTSSHVPDAQQVKSFLLGLQQNICQRLELLDGKATFKADSWEREEGGGGTSRVLTQGQVFEQAGVNFSHVMGAAMPASATAHRPGRGRAALPRCARHAPTGSWE